MNSYTNKSLFSGIREKNFFTEMNEKMNNFGEIDNIGLLIMLKMRKSRFNKERNFTDSFQY